MTQFDVNQFRNQNHAEDDFKRYRTDLMLGAIVAVMLVGTGGAFAYSKMDFSQAYAANPQAQTTVAQLRTSSPETRDINEAFDSNPILKMQKRRAEKLAAPILEQEKRKQSMPITEYVLAKDLTGAQAQVEKFSRTRIVLKHCGSGFRDIYDHYENKNQKRVIQLSKKAYEESPIAKSQEEIKNIKTPADVMRFKLSGGADRHMQASMGMMAAIGGLNGGRKAKSQQECQKVKQMAQTGRLDVRL